MLYIAQTGCQWRYLPESFGPWTRVWSQFRRWSRNGTWAQALTVLHAVAGRVPANPRPSTAHAPAGHVDENLALREAALNRQTLAGLEVGVVGSRPKVGVSR